MLKTKRVIKHFKTLMTWEFEEINIFTLGFIIFVATTYILHPMVSYSSRGIIIERILDFNGFQVRSSRENYLFYPGNVIDAIELLVVFLAGILFASNVARAFENREMLTLLTCPTKRHHVILSKFSVNFLILYFAFGIPFALDMMLLGINPLNLDMYIWLFILFLPILFACSIALFASVTLKTTGPSAVIPPLMFLGLIKLLDSVNEEACDLLYSTWDEKLFNAVKNFLSFSLASPWVGTEFSYVVLYRLLLPVLLIVLSVIYFQKWVQLD